MRTAAKQRKTDNLPHIIDRLVERNRGGYLAPNDGQIVAGEAEFPAVFRLKVRAAHVTLADETFVLVHPVPALANRVHAQRHMASHLQRVHVGHLEGCYPAPIAKGQRLDAQLERMFDVGVIFILNGGLFFAQGLTHKDVEEPPAAEFIDHGLLLGEMRPG